MQLVAYINGERVDATEMAHKPWRDLVNHPRYAELVLIECDLRASRVTSHKGRQYFAHYPNLECPVVHKSESPQHLAMKEALKVRINAAPGWSGDVEVAHPERAWTADVMAIHESGRRLAFEVQLSQQTEEEYIRRSQLYADDGIGPVWVVPEDLEWFTVKLPMIVTGFGKTSALPEDPASLMACAAFQPLTGKMGWAGAMVDTVLHPSFKWPHGTPRHQLEELERLARERAVKEAAAQKEQARLAKEKRLADEAAALAEAERVARFVGSAAAPGVPGVEPVLAGTRIWASEVRCLKAGHPMLIWRLTNPDKPNAVDPKWMPQSESFANVRSRVDSWLTAAGSGLAKAGIHYLKGFGKRRAFTCPECKDVIRGRWVTALPPAKWSVIAEGSTPRDEAREVLNRRPPLPPPAPAGPHELKREPVLRVESEGRPAILQAGDPEFIGPRPWMLWMSEAGEENEIAERQAAKDARAA